MVLFGVSPMVAAHLSTALRLYREQLRRDHIATPAELHELERFFAERASPAQPGAHSGSRVDRSASIPQPRRMNAHTHSYHEAATWLGVSHSTVKRLVAADRLSTVQVGGRKRIHVEDLEHYLNDQRSTTAC